MVRRLSKYRNVWTAYRSPMVGLRNYQSKAEAKRAAELDLLVRAGDVEFWLPQPSFPLPGGTSYKADFQIHWAYPRKFGLPSRTHSEHGSVTFEDVKGRDTKMSKLKRAQVKEIYGIDIVIVKA